MVTLRVLFKLNRSQNQTKSHDSGKWIVKKQGKKVWLRKGGKSGRLGVGDDQNVSYTYMKSLKN